MVRSANCVPSAGRSGHIAEMLQLVRRKFYFHGVVLILLGLLTGLAVGALPNPRMGLSAHLEGVLNGFFLILLGLIWGEVRLSERASRAARALALYATYANWIATLLSAVFGTSKMTPLAGAGHVGAAWQEGLVALLLVTLALSIIGCCVLLLRGLAGADAAPGEPST